MKRSGWPGRAFALGALLVGLGASPVGLAEVRPAAVHAATLTVTNTDDGGPGSLRAAVADAAAGDTIAFGINGTITLGSTMTLNKDLTIDGSGKAVTISGGGNVQVFVVSSGVIITLSHLTIANGSATVGGGIENDGGTLSVTDSTFNNNAAATTGGGIDNNGGALSVNNSTFSRNGVDEDGGGGGIFNNGALTVTDSTFSRNDTLVADGVGIYNAGTLSITNSTFSGNETTLGDGAGIYNTGSGTLSVTGSTFSGNYASHSVSAGGGIANFGTLSVTDSAFSGNGAGAGGSIFNNGTLSVTDSAFSGNGAMGGGGIANDSGTLTVTSSTFSGNYASGGGGSIGNDSDSTLTVTNSTFSGNSTGRDGRGAGIANGGTLSVTDSTFSGNNAPVGGGILNNGSATLANTILASSTGGDCNGPTAITDRGGNLADDGTCGVTQVSTASLNLDPKGLQHNGGATQTIALLPGSAAIDFTTCLQSTDQRGSPRPDAGDAGVTIKCDSGAYEFQDDTDLSLANVPANVTTNATSPQGAVVPYPPPTAADEDSPLPAVVCAPASGSTFPIGATTVTCTATDGDDTNSPVAASFTVTVQGAAAQIGDLIGLVDSFDLPHGLQTSLDAKLQLALTAVQAGTTPAACHDLTAFSNEVHAQADKKLTVAQAKQLLAAASNIMKVLGC